MGISKGLKEENRIGKGWGEGTMQGDKGRIGNRREEWWHHIFPWVRGI
jgi:hypothetical protein